MKNPQKYITVDKESAKTLNQTGGLGTVATRDDINNPFAALLKDFK